MNLYKQKDPAQKDIKFILDLLSSSKFNEAKKEIDTQIIKFPYSSVLFNILGAIFAGQDQLDKAIENYKKAIEINPNYAQAYNNLGIALHKLFRMDKAIESYQKAISINSNFAEPQSNLGNAMLEINKPKESLIYFEKE